MPYLRCRLPRYPYSQYLRTCSPTPRQRHPVYDPRKKSSPGCRLEQRVNPSCEPTRGGSRTQSASSMRCEVNDKPTLLTGWNDTSQHRGTLLVCCISCRFRFLCRFTVKCVVFFTTGLSLTNPLSPSVTISDHQDLRGLFRWAHRAA